MQLNAVSCSLLICSFTDGSGQQRTQDTAWWDSCTERQGGGVVEAWVCSR